MNTKKILKTMTKILLFSRLVTFLFIANINFTLKILTDVMTLIIIIYFKMLMFIINNSEAPL